MSRTNGRRTRAAIAATLCMAAGIAACSRTATDEKSGVSAAATARVDTSAGDVAQYSLMTDAVGWLTDSNLVALASIVNDGPLHLARAEAQQSSAQQVHDFAVEIIRDHAAFQIAIDSLAGKRRIPSQRPAVAESMQAPYDSAVASLASAGVSSPESRFLSVSDAMHVHALTDLAALSGNATDPDLRLLFAARATAMEQRHLARSKQIAATLAQADSAKQVSRTGRKKP